MSARTGARWGPGSRSWSSLSRSMMPSTAATLPWGRERAISKACCRRADGGVALEDQAQGFDLFGGPVGEIGEGAVFDFAVLAEGLAQEDGGRGIGVGHGGDIHADCILIYIIYVNTDNTNYMTT